MRAKDLTPKRQVIILKVDGKPLIKSTDQQKILDFQKFLKQKDPNLKIEVIQQPEYFEEEKKALDILDTEISALIKKISNSEAQRRTARAPRYLVYGEYVGSALETNSFFVALAKAKEVAQKGGLDSPVVVYDRKTNFPVVSYLGAEDMWYKTDTSSRKAVNEKWTKKYKKSINCSNPKGFSQKAHCAGRKARQAGKHTKSKSISEYGEIDSQRKIEFSKDNPPPFDHLYNQFIQAMLSLDNKIEPQVWIDNVNKLYGLNYKYKDYQNRGHRDYTNNWDKVVNRYVLNKKA